MASSEDESDSISVEDAGIEEEGEQVTPLRKVVTGDSDEEDDLEDLRPRSRQRISVGRVPRDGRGEKGRSSLDYRVSAGRGSLDGKI